MLVESLFRTFLFSPFHDSNHQSFRCFRIVNFEIFFIAKRLIGSNIPKRFIRQPCFIYFRNFLLLFYLRADEEPVDPKKYLEDRCKPQCVKPFYAYEVCT
jgi:hypothetical protein